MAKKKAARRPEPNRRTKSKTTQRKAPSRGKTAIAAAKKTAKAKKSSRKDDAQKPQTSQPSADPALTTKKTKKAKAVDDNPPQKAPRRVTAEELSEKQREISISEFFTKNRHLLGFDNASRALLTSVKEAVDNSLDACEEAGILPDIGVRIEQTSEGRYCMTVSDNGPGIVKAQIPKVFGQLLYGSKFHRLRQSRGQQGIGISAAGMYGQLTTGKPVVVRSKTAKGKAAHLYELVIDTQANQPKIIRNESFDWTEVDHGTSVSIEMEAIYKGGKRSVDEYVQAVAFANPHVRLTYWRPNKPPLVYPRLTEQMPEQAKEIKPHPYGVELGILMRMLAASKSRNLSGFLQSEFSRVSQVVANEICANAKVPGETSTKDISQEAVEAIYGAIAQTKIMSPPTTCLAPIGEDALLKGLRSMLVQQHIAAEESRLRRKQEEQDAAAPEDKSAVIAAEAKVQQALQAITEVSPEEDDEPLENAGVIEIFGKPCFLTAVTRAPKVYRGNPFQVEAALAYGANLNADDLAQVYRFANRVPLLYQQGACATSQAIVRTNWKSYDIPQARGALPSGPMLLLVHIASVWVPFTSEAKEAVAHYDEIITELKFALQECGRRVHRHLRRRRRVADADKKRKYIESYIPHIGDALQEILGLTDARREGAVDQLTGILERSRKM
ncbi:MAG: DNA topoisomerase VI subunit B [Myxococcota bacterium]